MRTLNTQLYVALPVFIRHLLLCFLASHFLHLRNDICFQGKSNAECRTYFYAFFFKLSFFVAPEVLEQSNFCLPAFYLAYVPWSAQGQQMSQGELQGKYGSYNNAFPLSLEYWSLKAWLSCLFSKAFMDVFLIFYPAFRIAYVKRSIWYKLLIAWRHF